MLIARAREATAETLETLPVHLEILATLASRTMATWPGQGYARRGPAGSGAHSNRITQGKMMGSAGRNSLVVRVGVLAVCQALSLSVITMLIAMGGVLGYQLAPAKSLATLPIASQLLSTMTFLIPASMFMQRHGRRAGFVIGGVFGVAGGGLLTLSVLASSFLLLVAATFLIGVFWAFAQYLRFAATDGTPAHLRGRAVSLVLVGGLAAAFLGPALARWSEQAFASHTFLGAGLAMAALAALQALVAGSLLRIPAQPGGVAADSVRPLRVILVQQRLVIAVLAGTVGYASMTLMMSAAPVAMHGIGHPFGLATTVIQWHVVGMFLPSFFTGEIIRRFGVLQTILAGIFLIAVAGLVALGGTSFAHFVGALVCLGAGWNFMYVGGTTLLTETHTAAERAAVQATNDFIIFSANVAASVAAGVLLEVVGWTGLAWAILPVLALAGVLVVRSLLRPAPTPAPSEG